jgi:peptidase M1-like protein
MSTLRALIVALALAFAVSDAPAAALAPQTPGDAVTAVLRRVEQILQRADAPGFLALLADSADREQALAFATFELQPGVTKAVVQERDRQPLAGTLPGNGYRLMLDVFEEYGTRARIATWRLDLKRTREASAPGEMDEWRIADEERLNVVENLYRLALDPAKQYDAHDLTVAAEDIELTLAEGSVFVAAIDQGVTGVVLMGRGEVRFHPAPATEQGQVKIFCGAETLESRFDTAFIRMNPSDFERFVSKSQITARPVDPRDLRHADEVFHEESPKSFGLDLGDLTREPWSLLPSAGDFLAEIHTRRFDSLTYARSGSEAEDITLFDRKRHRNIAIYASLEKLARRGPFYNEDDLADYDILDYDIDLALTPDREWIDGRAKIRLKAKSYALGTVSLRLADPLVVQSIISDQYGRLFGIRVKNQNTIVVNLPNTVPRDTELALTITYAGRLAPQAADRETAGAGAGQRGRIQEDAPIVVAEPSFLYSSRSFWYPQGPISDYATATLRVSVPADLACVASGELAPGSPTLMPARDPAQTRKLYVFRAAQPLRYLAFLVSRFVRAEATTIVFDRTDAPDDSGLPPFVGQNYSTMKLAVEANPRQQQRGRELADRAVGIAQYYASLLGDSPYPSFTLALIESELPGGHSPGYFAALNEPLPTSPFVWRNDPAAFTNFPEFFLAHELAHQWWGQAVGWRNYHEQWLSEGFAQYFAALYAQHQRGDETFVGVLRQLRRWGMSESDQGPIYLGYRLGHIRGESRTFRALVYNKGAAVLHMLRRLAGDDRFFRGLRRFYRASRFRKVGTEDFRRAMEQETGLPLERFFERWIYGSTLPKLKFSYRVEGPDVVLHVDQIGDLFDVPVTVTLQYADRKSVDVVVAVTERAADLRVRLAGPLRTAEVNKDDGTLADFVRD